MLHYVPVNSHCVWIVSHCPCFQLIKCSTSSRGKKLVKKVEIDVSFYPAFPLPWSLHLPCAVQIDAFFLWRNLSISKDIQWSAIRTSSSPSQYPFITFYESESDLHLYFSPSLMSQLYSSIFKLLFGLLQRTLEIYWAEEQWHWDSSEVNGDQCSPATAVRKWVW